MEENITPDVVEESLPYEETVAEVTAEPTETESEEGSQQETMTTEEKKAFLTGKYNGEDKDWTEDEARELTQKGMNYDKVLEKASKYESNPLYKWADEYAKEMGKTPEEFVEAVRKEKEVTQHQEAVEKYKAIYGEEAAEKMATIEKELNELKGESASKKEEAEKNKKYSEFIEWHKAKTEKGTFSEALDIDKMPQEVWDSVNDGLSLKEAYMDYQLDNNTVLTEQATMKKLEHNSKTSTGSITEGSSAEEQPMTREYIESMTAQHGDKWVTANFDKIDKTGYFGKI